MTGDAPGEVDSERLLTATAGAVAAVCLLVWAAAATATWVTAGTWGDVSVWDSPALVWRVVTHPKTAPVAGVTAAVFYTTLVLHATAAAGTGYAAWRWWSRHHRTEEQTARWARPRDLKPLLVRRPQPGRLTLGTVAGRLVATESQHSVAVIGPAGTGKTTGFAIPALLEWDGPVVATSVKADLLEHTITPRRRQGQVWVYDPTGSTSQPTAGWNPLHGCDDWQQALRMAAWLVSTARAGDKGGLQDSDFWYAVAQKLLAPLLYGAATSHATIADVVRWVDLQDDQEPITALHHAGNLDALQAFAATLGREERSRSSAYTTTETVLAAFTDPAVTATTTITPAFTPDQLLDGGSHTLYVCGPLHEQARLRPLFTALIEETINAVYTRANHPHTHLKKPLLLVIDEAANIAPLPDLAQIASTARGVGIQLVTIWQDLAQLQARYGTFAQTVINNHRAKVVLAGISDGATLDYLTRLIGDHTTHEQTQTRDPHGSIRSTTNTTRQRPLAPPHLLRQTPTGQGTLIYGNLTPARLHLRRHRPI